MGKPNFGGGLGVGKKRGWRGRRPAWPPQLEWTPGTVLNREQGAIKPRPALKEGLASDTKKQLNQARHRHRKKEKKPKILKNS